MDREKFDKLVEIDERIRDIKEKRTRLEFYIETKIIEKSGFIAPVVKDSSHDLRKFINSIIAVIRSHYDDTELNKLEEEFKNM